MGRRLLLVLLMVPLVPLVALHGPSPAGASPLVVATRLAVARFANPAVAQEAGYQAASVTNGVEHWLNPGLAHHGPVLDPERPQGLVYVETGHGLRLAAALFVLDHAGQLPPAVAGATWHQHSWCQGVGGIGFPLPGGPCPPGTAVQVGPDMLHVWLANVPVEPFTTDMTPRLVCLLAGGSASPGGF
jgi:hypothetical protein